MVAAAVVAAGVATAGATAYAGSQQAKASSNAANAQIGFQEQALNTLQQNLAPYQQLGTSAIPGLQGAMANEAALVSKQQNMTPQQILQANPGYQFQLSQGLQASQNAASALGMNLSGNQLESLNNYAQGAANTAYGNALNANQQQLMADQQLVNNQFNLVGLGANAASQVGQSGANIYQNMGNTMANMYTNQGNIAAATTGGISNTLSSGLELYGMGAFNNPGTVPPAPPSTSWTPTDPWST